MHERFGHPFSTLFHRRWIARAEWKEEEQRREKKKRCKNANRAHTHGQESRLWARERKQWTKWLAKRKIYASYELYCCCWWLFVDFSVCSLEHRRTLHAINFREVYEPRKGIMHSHVWRQTVGPCTFSSTNAELNETKRGRVGICYL